MFRFRLRVDLPREPAPRRPRSAPAARPAEIPQRSARVLPAPRLPPGPTQQERPRSIHPEGRRLARRLGHCPVPPPPEGIVIDSPQPHWTRLPAISWRRRYRLPQPVHCRKSPWGATKRGLWAGILLSRPDAYASRTTTCDGWPGVECSKPPATLFDFFNGQRTARERKSGGLLFGRIVHFNQEDFDHQRFRVASGSFGVEVRAVDQHINRLLQAGLWDFRESRPTRRRLPTAGSRAT